MSCNTATRRLANAATRSGVPASVSQKSFYLGLVVVGTLLGSLLLSGQRRRQGQARSAPKTTAAPPARLPILSGPERVEPIPPNELREQPCAQCRTSSQHKPGPWYRLQGQSHSTGSGQAYCQDCAQDKAREAGVSLVPPPATAASTILSPKSFHPKAYLPKRTTLKPKTIKVGPLDNLEGYAVLVRGKTPGYP